MKSTSDLRLRHFPFFLMCCSPRPFSIPFINYLFDTPTLHSVIGCYQSTNVGPVKGSEKAPLHFRISPRVPVPAWFPQECCIHFQELADQSLCCKVLIQMHSLGLLQQGITLTLKTKFNKHFKKYLVCRWLMYPHFPYYLHIYVQVD